MRNRKKIQKISIIVISLLLAIAILASTLLPVFAEEKEETSVEAKYMRAVIQMILGEYKFDADETEMYRDILDYVLTAKPELLEGAILAATESLDEYSTYFTQDELKSFMQILENEYVGIGVVIERITGGILISEVMPGGSAYSAGLKMGDKLIAVEGKDVTSLSVNEVSAKVRGENGTYVKLTVERNGEKIEFNVMRAPVTAGSASSNILNEKVGYIYITGFSSTTAEEVKTILESFDEKNIKKIIVDVRDNPGGELGSVINTLSLFVPAGKLLLTIDYKAQGYDLRIKSRADFFEKPDREVVVVVNENSASAAEVFAGGIMYNDIGVTVGRKTYGKGSVQEFVGLYNLPGHSLGDMKLTVAEYRLPNGESINGEGLEPTHRVKNVYEDLDTKGIMPLMYDKKYTVGDSGYGVLAVKQRLNLLGYNIGEVNSVYDEETAVAVRSFQAATNLYPYGVADFTTQAKLGEVVESTQVLIDRQLDKAYELLTGEHLLLEEKVEGE